MRDIKFRAWNKAARKFTCFSKAGLLWDVMNKVHLSFKPEGEVYITEYGDLEQYTEINDMDGKEIYEGDIVEYTDGDFIRRRGQIEFDCYGFMLNEIKGRQVDFLGTIDDMEEMAFKVVGNIYENPDLLEVHFERRAGRV